MPFLMLWEKEAQNTISKMLDLFDEEYMAKAYRRDLLSQGREEGFREGYQEGLQKAQRKAMGKLLRKLISATG